MPCLLPQLGPLSRSCLMCPSLCMKIVLRFLNEVEQLLWETVVSNGTVKCKFDLPSTSLAPTRTAGHIPRPQSLDLTFTYRRRAPRRVALIAALASKLTLQVKTSRIVPDCAFPAIFRPFSGCFPASLARFVAEKV